MTPRERFLHVLEFKKPDKFPLIEFFGFWPETRMRWIQEGLGENEDIFEHFGLMKLRFVPIDFNLIPPFEQRVIQEDEYYQIIIDALGCTKKIIKNSSAMPHYIDFPIKGRKDFYHIKERMNALDYQQRYPSNWQQLLEEYNNRDYPLGLTIRGPFAFCRDFINFEHLMFMVYDDPDLLEEMMNFQLDFTIQLWEKVLSEVEIDFIVLGEDLAYKTGPMFSPKILEVLVKPLYRKLAGFLLGHGVKHFILDSDGNIMDLIPMFIESGITGIVPVENAAGMDPLLIRKLFPTFQMIGGINKLKVAEGGTALDATLQSVGTLIQTGGYIPSFDHSVPPILSFDDYGNYLQKLRKVIADCLAICSQ